jgi:VWFA-related protein
LALPLFSQEPPPVEAFGESIDVNVVNLTVNVSDREGNPVRGLTAEDFEVLVDGKSLDISNFYGVDGSLDLDPGDAVPRRAVPPGRSATEGPTAIPPEDARHIAIFIDNSSLHGKNRRRVFQGLRDYVGDLTGPNDLYMVVAFRSEYELVQPFTNSPGDVVAAIDSLERAPAEGPIWESDQRMLIRSLADVDLAPTSGLGTGGMKVQSDQIMYLEQTRMIAQQARQNAKNTLGGLAYLIGSMSGLPGKKVVLFLSEGLEMRPAEALFHAHYNRFEAAAEVYGFDRSLDPPQIIAQEYDLSGDIEQLAAYAQAHEVSLSSIDAAGPNAAFAGAADARLRDNDSVAVAGYKPVWSQRLDMLHTQNRQSTLQTLAEQTGGQVLLNTRDYAEFFRTFDDNLNVYYSIGFVADRDVEGGRHELVVKVRPPGLRVAHRRTYVDKTWAQILSERTLSRTVLGSGANEFEMQTFPGEITLQDDGRYILPIHVFVPVKQLTLLPNGDEYTANLSVAIVVKKPSGSTEPAQVMLLGLRLPKDAVDQNTVETGEAAVRLLIDAGPQEIGIGVRDQASGATSTTSFVIDPAGNA